MGQDQSVMVEVVVVAQAGKVVQLLQPQEVKGVQVEPVI
jgi:hypothetical protein